MSGLTVTLLSKFEHTMKKFEDATHLALAVSGGIDSIVLCNLCSAWKRNNCKNTRLSALFFKTKVYSSTINVDIVKKNMERLGIEYEILEDEENISRTLSADRILKYRKIFEWCIKNKVRHVLTGHQKDDNTESFFMGLERGSGLDGLIGIAETKKIIAQDILCVYKLPLPDDGYSSDNEITLIRPMLNINRNEIFEYAIENQLQWHNDPYNENNNSKRIAIRKSINIRPDKNRLKERVSHAIHLLKQEQSSMIYYTGQAALKCLKILNTGCIKIKKDGLESFHIMTVMRLVIYSLMCVGNHYYKPRHKSLSDLTEAIIENVNLKMTLHGCQIISTYTSICINREPALVQSQIVDTNKEILWDGRLACKIVNSKSEKIIIRPRKSLYPIPQEIKKLYDGSTTALPLGIDENHKLLYPMVEHTGKFDEPYIEISKRPIFLKMNSLLYAE